MHTPACTHVHPVVRTESEIKLEQQADHKPPLLLSEPLGDEEQTPPPPQRLRLLTVPPPDLEQRP